MGRINLYIADALEERMAGFRDRLNWSRIAQEAFEQAIEREEKKMISIEEGQLERLRQSRRRVRMDHAVQGVRAGTEWALNRADFDQLERVVSWDIHSLPDDAAFEYELAAVILDVGEGSIEDLDDALTEILGYEPDPLLVGTRAFVEGFVQGATEVYAAV